MSERLDTLRSQNRFRIIIVVALLPIMAFAAFVAHDASEVPALPYLLMLMWLVALGGALYRMRTFRCPRCGKTFSVEGWWLPRLRDDKCVHCALRLDAG